MYVFKSSKSSKSSKGSKGSKSFKSSKSSKSKLNVFFQILCKSSTILLYRCEENIKKLLNRFTADTCSQAIKDQDIANN